MAIMALVVFVAVRRGGGADVKVVREIILGGAVTALFAGVVLTALKWQPETATFPLLIGVAGLGLAVWAMVGDVLRWRSAAVEGDGPSGEDTARARAAFLWIAVFFALVLLIGFRWGLPLAVLAYYRLEGARGLDRHGQRRGGVRGVSARRGGLSLPSAVFRCLVSALVRRRNGVMSFRSRRAVSDWR